MKIGFRVPSIKKRIAARTSLNRVVRNSLGLKAPRGWGWLTKDHIVILCHDEMFRKSWEETELKQLIERLKATGLYEFSYLSEYPQNKETAK